jgi:hypothetical protein
MTQQFRALMSALMLSITTGAALAQHMDTGSMPAAASAVAGAASAQALLQKIKSLEGTWDAPMGDGGTITDIFRPFAMGTKVLGEEWVNGKQITSTVFYVVGSELYADHYCDYLNEPRYTAKPSADPAVIDLEFRDATNLDTHPAHFHSTQWRIVDADHLIQDWVVLGGKKPVSTIHLAFTRRVQSGN